MSQNLLQPQPDAKLLVAGAPPEERLRALIESISAYIEHYHGGAVEFVRYQDDMLYVRLQGACVGCDLAPVTLHGWVEGTVRQFFPELKDVVEVL